MAKIKNVDGLRKLAKKLNNWGKWGPNDELGTLNYVTPQAIAKATALVKKGKVFHLGIELNMNGPQRHGVSRRFNPIHVMFHSGADTIAGTSPTGWGGADDMIAIATQGGTHWDALCHIHAEGGKMWNGYDARLCSGQGAEKNGIEKYRNNLVHTTIHETKMGVKLGNTFWGICTLINPLDCSQNSIAILQAASRADLSN